MIFKDKTDFISDPIPVLYQPVFDAYVMVDGPGPAAIELKGEDGVWRSYPETEFDGPAAVQLTLPRGEFRVVISGGPTTVEVRL